LVISSSFLDMKFANLLSSTWCVPSMTFISVFRLRLLSQVSSVWHCIVHIIKLYTFFNNI
jgi:hypothetical protein